MPALRVHTAPGSRRRSLVRSGRSLSPARPASPLGLSVKNERDDLPLDAWRWPPSRRPWRAQAGVPPRSGRHPTGHNRLGSLMLQAPGLQLGSYKTGCQYRGPEGRWGSTGPCPSRPTGPRLPATVTRTPAARTPRPRPRRVPRPRYPCPWATAHVILKSHIFHLFCVELLSAA